VQPFIALALGLQAAGHRVCIATHINFESFVRRHGLDFFLLGTNPEEGLDTKLGKAMIGSGNNPLRFLRMWRYMAGPIMKQLFTDCWNACQNTDAIFCSSAACYIAHSIGEKLHIPVIPSLLQPYTRTRSFPNYIISAEVNLGGSYNWLTHVLADQLIWHPFRSTMNTCRRELLNLSPLPFTGDVGWLHKQHSTILYGYSPSVVPKPADWNDSIHITGYWFLDRSENWSPPPDLVAFLEAGPPPVYVGFGSMKNRNPREATELVLKALHKSGQRGVLMTGWGGLSKIDMPENVFLLHEIAHDWLFPRTAAVVHHGGAGTTAAGLRAGVPSIIIPFLIDQPFWGHRVAALGVGPRPIPRQKLTVDNLAAAITEATSNADMRRRAATLGARIRAEKGVTRAVEAFHTHLEERSFSHRLTAIGSHP
jgi:UDP:flavonoid glycosyltransferase YjiC (YdhE family)